VTFLFTDVEDSTALWEQFPRVMPEAFARHDAMLREAIAGHGGHIFTIAGDGFGAAFTSAPDAVAAAVDAQRSLASQSWPGDVAVRVRMGLHTGIATERDGNYFGGVVNRAARIAGIGRGGQTLLSAATANLVADEGWTMVNLGPHRLRGLERPERIVRLDASGLPVVAQSLRTSRERTGNLPRRPTRLIGREDELRRLVDLLGTRRLVTIIGPGGAGKTRLAIAAADAVADQFADGTWLVELGELQHAADVVSAVVTTLALQPAAGADHSKAIVDALADQQALLLLDNCEHLIDGVIQLVSELESYCDRITVLTTSREALGFGHEVRFSLHPLALGAEGSSSAAVQLFCERAAGVLGSFRPSDTDIAVIDEICRRLDGLPLAIELATPRLSAMNLTELRTGLDDGFALLARRRGVTARHQSLGATVAWSSNLLTAAEQSLFDQLSTFGADFGLAAARAVGEDSSVPVDDLLMSLVDKSLLTTVRGPLGTRFRQLETLRQYGEAHLDARGGTTANMRRQLDYYVAWTESADAGIRSSDELHWHQAFTTEWPNIRNAFRWACRVDDADAASRLVGATLWWATSRMRIETERWCDLAVGVPSGTNHRLRPALLGAAALFAHMRNDGDCERRWLELALAEEARLGPAAEPWVKAALLNQWSGGPAAALRDATALRRQAEAAGDQFWQLIAALGEALILATLTRRAATSADQESGYVSRIRQVVAQAEAFGQPSSVASAWASLGTALRSSEPTEALTLLEKASDLCAPLDVDDVANAARRELASHYTQLGRPLDALTLMRTAIPYHLRIGAWHEIGEELRYVAPILTDAGRPRVAATVLGRVGAESSALNRGHDRPALEDQLRDSLGATEFSTLLTDSQSLSVADVAQLVVKTIDELTKQAG
jgi:predicted ATPase/class 3 adenylate cyclase